LKKLKMKVSEIRPQKYIRSMHSHYFWLMDVVA